MKLRIIVYVVLLFVFLVIGIHAYLVWQNNNERSQFVGMQVQEKILNYQQRIRKLNFQISQSVRRQYSQEDEEDTSPPLSNDTTLMLPDIWEKAHNLDLYIDAIAITDKGYEILNSAADDEWKKWLQRFPKTIPTNEKKRIKYEEMQIGLLTVVKGFQKPVAYLSTAIDKPDKEGNVGRVLFLRIGLPRQIFEFPKGWMGGIDIGEETIKSQKLPWYLPKIKIKGEPIPFGNPKITVWVLPNGLTIIGWILLIIIAPVAAGFAIYHGRKQEVRIAESHAGTFNNLGHSVKDLPPLLGATICLQQELNALDVETQVKIKRALPCLEPMKEIDVQRLNQLLVTDVGTVTLSGRSGIRIEKCDLMQIINRLENKCQEKRIGFKLQLKKEAPIQVHSHELPRNQDTISLLFDNLFDNAVYFISKKRIDTVLSVLETNNHSSAWIEEASVLKEICRQNINLLTPDSIIEKLGEIVQKSKCDDVKSEILREILQEIWNNIQNSPLYNEVREKYNEILSEMAQTTNASQQQRYFPKIGQIDVVIRPSYLSRKKIVVYFSDNGEGIEWKNRHKVFELFYTARPRGSGIGIGLGAAKRSVRSLGGNIKVVRSSKGAKFKITLKLFKEESHE